MDDISPSDSKSISTLLKERRDEASFIGTYSKPGKKKKEEIKILVVGKHRVYEFKTGGKLQQDAHILDLQEISSPSDNDLKLVFKGAKFELSSPKTNEIINAIRLSFQTTFAGMPEEQKFKLNVPPTRLQDLPEQTDAVLGGFAATYQSLCDYHGVVVREDIVWDLLNVFPASNVKDFNLREFEWPLSSGDLRCLMGALHFNKWFNSFIADGFPFQKDTWADMALLLKNNTHMGDLVIPSASVNKDGLVKVAEGLAANKNTSLSKIDLHDNPMEDKGLVSLAKAFETMSQGVVFLDLSRCGVGKVGIAGLGTALTKNPFMSSTLTDLNLSYNKLEPEGSSAIAAWLAKPNGLRNLNLAYTSPNLEVIMGAIVRGCQELQVMDVSGNKITAKESTHLTQFLRSSSTLKELSINNTEIRVEFLKEVLKGMCSNPYLVDFTVSFAENKLGTVAASVIGNIIADAKNIAYLDVSDNDLGDEGIAVLTEGLLSNTSLKSLKIGKNWSPKGTKQRMIALENIISLISGECPLKALTLDGNAKAKLGTDIITFLNALGTNDSLSFLDVSGNGMGNKGATALGKAIQTNNTLTTLYWDDNGTTLQGFQTFKMGLDRNLTLKDMPLPVLDIGAALKGEPERAKDVQALLSAIQNKLARNQSPKKSIDTSAAQKKSNASLGQLKILSSGEREMIERLRFKIKSMGRKLNEDQQQVVADAENNDSVLSSLHFLAEEVQYGMQEKLKEKLKTLVANLMPVFSEQYRELVSRSMQMIQEKYSSLDADTIRRLGMNINFGGSELEADTVEKILIDSAGSELAQRANESFFSAVQIATDYIYEKLGDQLKEILDDLQHHRNESSGKKDEPSKPEKSSSRSLLAASVYRAAPAPEPERVVEKPAPAPAPEPVPRTPSPTRASMFGGPAVDAFGVPRPTPPPRRTAPGVPGSPGESAAPAGPSAGSGGKFRPPIPGTRPPVGGSPGAGPGPAAPTAGTGSGFGGGAPSPVTGKVGKLAMPGGININVAALAPGGMPRPAPAPVAREPAPAPVSSGPPTVGGLPSKATTSSSSAKPTPAPQKPSSSKPSGGGLFGFSKGDKKDDKKDPKKDVKASGGGSGGGGGSAAGSGVAGIPLTVSGDTANIEAVPVVESNIENHMTRDRPMIQRKRRPPARRPRGPMGEE